MCTVLIMAVCVCLSLAAFPYYCMDADVTWWCPLVVRCWMHLQSEHRFHCYDSIAPNAKCQRVLVLALCVVLFYSSHKHCVYDRWYKSTNHISGGERAWRCELQHASCSCSTERWKHLCGVDFVPPPRAVTGRPSVHNAARSTARRTPLLRRTNPRCSRVCLLRRQERLRSIVMSMSACVSVCLSDRISPEPLMRSLPNFLCMLPMSVAQSSSGMFTISRTAYRREGDDGPIDSAL